MAGEGFQRRKKQHVPFLPRKTSYREAGRGHVSQAAFMLGQQALEDLSQYVRLVIDDVGKLH